jgi:hypothetical protein
VAVFRFITENGVGAFYDRAGPAQASAIDVGFDTKQRTKREETDHGCTGGTQSD